MTRYWSAPLRQIEPYVPGLQLEDRELIKLNTNESPFGPSPGALDAMREAANSHLRLYPEPTSRALRGALATEHGVTPDEIYVGNGSDEVLAHTFLGFLKQDRPLSFPDITYGFYPVYCRLFGITYETIPLREDYGLDIDAFADAQGPIIFPNPNAPTGIAIARGEIADILTRRPDRLVVVDEAYVDFGAETAVPLIQQFPNLLVVQTMSKSRGLAGLRVGYALGHPDLIEGLRRIKDSLNSYPVGRIAEAGAIAALADGAYFRTTVDRVVRARADLCRQLDRLGFETLPSSANFVYTRHPALPGAALAEQLLTRGVLVRFFSGPRTAPFVRITVGTDAQVGQLAETLRSLLEKTPNATAS